MCNHIRNSSLSNLVPGRINVITINATDTNANLNWWLKYRKWHCEQGHGFLKWQTLGKALSRQG